MPDIRFRHSRGKTNFNGCPIICKPFSARLVCVCLLQAWIEKIDVSEGFDSVNGVGKMCAGTTMLACHRPMSKRYSSQLSSRCVSSRLFEPTVVFSKLRSGAFMPEPFHSLARCHSLGTKNVTDWINAIRETHHLPKQNKKTYPPRRLGVMTKAS